MRLFVALDIPDAVRAALSELSGRLRKICRSARWIGLDAAHVTLKFIGEVPPAAAANIAPALAQIHAAAPIEVRFARVGFFPDARRPRVFWAGIDESPALAALATAIEDALVPLGIARETREFRPHITLARLGSAHANNELAALRAAVATLGEPEFGRVTAHEFHLYRSVLRPAAAEHTRIATYDFSRERAA